MRVLKNPFRKSFQPFDDLEAHLDYTFSPVAPRAEFVDGLRSSLQRQWDVPVVDEPLSATARTLLIGVAAFLGGAVALVMGIRVVITILGSLGLLQQMKKQLPEGSAQPLRPAA